MRRIKTSSALVVLLLLNACASKVATAPGKQPQPVLDNIAVHLAQVLDGAKAVRKVKEALLAEGKITPAVSNQITKGLIKLDTGIKVMNEKLSTYESFSPTAKEDLKKLYADVKSSRQELITAGTIPSNAGIDRALVIIDAALAALDTFLR